MLARTVAKKILIVEDDADIRRLLQLRLRSQQYESAFAGDAVTALTIARKEQPDLILLDLGRRAATGSSCSSGFSSSRPSPGSR